MHRIIMAAAKAPAQLGPISAAIKRKVEGALSPAAFNIVNDSHKHAGHYEDDGSAARASMETHLRLDIVSEQFDGLSLVKRHQLVYNLLDDEIKQGVHALSMVTKTPKEIAAKQQ